MKEDPETRPRTTWSRVREFRDRIEATKETICKAWDLIYESDDVIARLQSLRKKYPPAPDKTSVN